MEEKIFFRVTLLVSGEIIFGGNHGMWRTIAYAPCILCDTVGLRRSFWIIRYSCVCTIRPLVSLYCYTAVVGSPLSRRFRRYYRPYPRSNFFFSAFRGGDLEKWCHGFCCFFRTYSPDFCCCVQKVFSSYVKTALFTLSFSGIMVFGGAHDMWITTAYGWFWAVLLDT